MGLFDRISKSGSNLQKVLDSKTPSSTEPYPISPSSQRSNPLTRIFARKDGFSSLKPTKEEREAKKLEKGFKRMAEMQSSQRMYGCVFQLPLKLSSNNDRQYYSVMRYRSADGTLVLVDFQDQAKHLYCSVMA